MLNTKSNTNKLSSKQKIMSDSTEKTLPNMIKDIIFFYVKFYYDKYLTQNELSILNETQIDDFINSHYTNKGKEIKEYVRNSLKKNLGNQYNSITVENILLELFNDIDMAKERLKIEIIDYQNNHL